MKARAFYGICVTVFLLILAAIVFYKTYWKFPKPIPVIEYKNTIVRDTLVDTVYISVNKYIPKIIYVDSSKNSEPTDTASAVKDYFAVKLIRDTILNDSRARIIIKDRLYRNTIISREPDIKIYNQNVETTITTVKTKTYGLYAGIMACGNENKFGLGISANLVLHDKSSIGLGVDVVNKEVYVMYNRKIF